MSTRNGFIPTINDVPFDPDVVAGLIQYLPEDKNSLLTAGVMFNDPRFVTEVGKNTGKLTIPAYTFDDSDADQDWTGQVDGDTSKLPSTSQSVVVVGKYKAWEVNNLANYIANGMSPEQAVLNYVSAFRSRQTYKIVKSMLKGIFSNVSISDKLSYDLDTKSLKTNDFIKARAKFWGDQADAPVFYIMHSVVYASLMSALTETTMVNFLQGARIEVDDNITSLGGDKYETYVFRANAIATSGDLVGSRSFRQTDELKNQGTDIIGYKRRMILALVGVSFKGELSNPVGATNAELENQANWELLQNLPNAHKYVRVGVIKSTEKLMDADTLRTVKGAKNLSED